jgi:aminoglycoside/choline kinase family phosphotransferase
LFLGLQLGREPTVNDDTSQFKIVLNQLKEEYGIQHNDADSRNMIYITGVDGVERIVAIDFEDWDLVKQFQYS